MLISVVYVSCSRILDNLSTLQKQAAHYNKKPFTNRSIERIEILINLLIKNRQFSSILIKHITKLQKERENDHSTPTHSKSWLFNEVSKLSNVIKYGTLKNSCRNYIEARLAALFSGLIAICDTNNNFDLLVNSEKEWIPELWLNMFNDDHIFHVTYSKTYLKTKDTKEKSEFNCLSYPYFVENKLKDSNLSLKLPFSWLIKENLDNLVSTKIKESAFFSKNVYDEQGNALNGDAYNQNVETNEILIKKSNFLFEQLESVFINSELYEKLKEMINDTIKTEFIDAYLNDFLLLSVNDPFINFTHFKIFKKRVLDYCKKNYCNNSNDLNMMIGIHLTFDELKQELHLFTKFGLLCHKMLDIVDKSEDSGSNLCYLASR